MQRCCCYSTSTSAVFMLSLVASYLQLQIQPYNQSKFWADHIIQLAHYMSGYLPSKIHLPQFYHVCMIICVFKELRDCSTSSNTHQLSYRSGCIDQSCMSVHAVCVLSYRPQTMSDVKLYKEPDNNSIMITIESILVFSWYG